MKTYLYPKLLAVLIVFLCTWQGNATMLTAQQTKGEDIPKLENPFNRKYLQRNLRKSYEIGFKFSREKV